MVCKIILTEPKYPGNTGFIARVMKNFGLEQLILVNPSFSIDEDECRRFAVHAQVILDNAVIASSLETVAKNLDYLVGTTSIESRDDRHHLRKTILARDFAEKVHNLSGDVGIAFGREDYGLLNEELKLCDILLKIPTSDTYPSLNLSHAVAVVLYDIFQSTYQPKKFIIIDALEKEKLFSYFDTLLDNIQYPQYKIEKTKILFRRVIGRSMLSKWEFHALMGVFKKTLYSIKETIKTKNK